MEEEKKEFTCYEEDEAEKASRCWVRVTESQMTWYPAGGWPGCWLSRVGKEEESRGDLTSCGLNRSLGCLVSPEEAEVRAGRPLG